MTDYTTITGAREGVRAHYSEIAPGVWEAELEWQDDYLRGIWHDAGCVTFTSEPDLAAIVSAVESYCSDQYDREMERRAAGH